MELLIMDADIQIKARSASVAPPLPNVSLLFSKKKSNQYNIYVSRAPA